MLTFMKIFKNYSTFKESCILQKNSGEAKMLCFVRYYVGSRAYKTHMLLGWLDIVYDMAVFFL